MAPYKSTGSRPAAGAPASAQRRGATPRDSTGALPASAEGIGAPPADLYPPITPQQRHEIVQAGLGLCASMEGLLSLLRGAILPPGAHIHAVAHTGIGGRGRGEDYSDDRRPIGERFAEEFDTVAERLLDVDSLLACLGAWIDAAEQGNGQGAGHQSGDTIRVTLLARQALGEIRKVLDGMCIRYRRWLRGSQELPTAAPADE